MNANLLTGIVIGTWGLAGALFGRTIYCAVKANKAQKELMDTIIEGRDRLQETARRAGINLDEKIEE